MNTSADRYSFHDSVKAKIVDEKMQGSDRRCLDRWR